MAALHVLRVFCAEDGSGGNPLGVFLDGHEITEERRQAVALDLGFAETVFVDDRESATLRIFTPTVELPLAGHPLVGAAWLLAREGEAVAALHPPRVRSPSGSTTASPGSPATRSGARRGSCASSGRRRRSTRSTAPRRTPVRSPSGHGSTATAGWIRQRVFAHEVGIVEDEATGSAAMRLVAALGREIEISQGAGSVIYARPRGRLAEVGGRVELEETREYG